MSNPLRPTLVLPFFGLLYRGDLVPLEEICSFFSKEIPLNSSLTFTCAQASLKNYYEKEMGPSEELKRAWVFGNKLIEREELLLIKLKSFEWEKLWQEKLGCSGRPINIDPGLTALEQVVLSTFKPYSHRIFLGKGVFCELTYQFQEGDFHSLPWTYPDYKESAVKESFIAARHFLKDQL